MIKTTEDEIRILGPNAKFTFSALGGPEDPIALAGTGDVELAEHEWNQLYSAFLNFSNTGYFNQEG